MAGRRSSPVARSGIDRTPGTDVAQLPPRERAVILIGLVSLAGLAWLHLAYMPDMVLARFGVTFLMWVVMMVAMMVPSAAPMIVMFARLKRERLGPATAVFLAGYLVVWSAFAFVAAAGETALRTAALVSGASARAVRCWAARSRSGRGSISSHR